MMYLCNLIAVVPLVIGMILLKRVWELHGTAQGSFLAAVCALSLSVALFCFGMGLALGLIVGLSMVGMAGIVASAVSADFGRPKILARPAPQVVPRSSVRQMLAGVWRLLLSGPIALCAGVAIGLVALSTLPGADADRLVGCTLVTVLGAVAMIAWTASDARLWRATLLSASVLAAFMTAAVMHGTPV